MAVIREIDLRAVISRLRAAGANSVNKVTKGMKKAALYIMNESQYLVPIDTKALHDSLRLEAHGRSIDNITVDIVYGDAVAYYGVWVHEDLTKAHGAAFNVKYAKEIAAGKTHARRPQETAKFLEIPIQNLTAIKAVLITEVLR